MNLRLSAAFGIVFGFACVASTTNLFSSAYNSFNPAPVFAQAGPVPLCRPEFSSCDPGGSNSLNRKPVPALSQAGPVPLCRPELPSCEPGGRFAKRKPVARK